jgi:hypothetical protein
MIIKEQGDLTGDDEIQGFTNITDVSNNFIFFTKTGSVNSIRVLTSFIVRVSHSCCWLRNSARSIWSELFYVVMHRLHRTRINSVKAAGVWHIRLAHICEFA